MVKKIIISASRRTDIPAFYTPWFMNRIREGYCHVPHPLFPKKKTNPVSLRPEDVEIIVFWTRNPKPLLPYLSELDQRGFHYYFLFTITGYPREIEPATPSISEAVEAFCQLSERVGKEKVIWRYDPILMTRALDTRWHCRKITQIAKSIQGCTHKLIISFVDEYRKLRLKFAHERSSPYALTPYTFAINTYLPLLQWLSQKAAQWKVSVVTCAETVNLANHSIAHGSCIDGRFINSITGGKKSHRKDPGQRQACKCVYARDIGVNNTCLFGCRYCYATNSLEKAQRNFRRHNTHDSYLIRL